MSPNAINVQIVSDMGSLPLEQVSRPLLRLVQYISGMETSFITAIDWEGQTQDVLFSLNTGEMQLPEGSRVNWSDSMCRSMFLSGRCTSSAVGVDVPATPGAVALEMKSFFAVPILMDDSPIGTVCGASRSDIVLSDDQIAAMQNIAEALQQLLRSDREKQQAEVRADIAELGALDAQSESRRHASDSRHMEHLAHTDMLTGVPNRRAFTVRWEDELARSGRRHYPIGLILIDADHFKSVNDSHGHAMGDAVLRAIGATLLALAHTPDVVARLGGDEFALVMTHADECALMTVAKIIRERFAIARAELGMTTTLSIGVAISDHSPRHRKLTDADAALYRSKAGGGDRASLFTNASEYSRTVTAAIPSR